MVKQLKELIKVRIDPGDGREPTAASTPEQAAALLEKYNDELRKGVRTVEGPVVDKPE